MVGIVAAVAVASAGAGALANRTEPVSDKAFNTIVDVRLKRAEYRFNGDGGIAVFHCVENTVADASMMACPDAPLVDFQPDFPTPAKIQKAFTAKYGAK